MNYIRNYALAAEEISGCYYICNYAFHDGEINVDASISSNWIEICLWMLYICGMRDGKIDA
nr:hypothetical protein Q903MT_gene6249 [Picea sitchensis]